MSASGLVKCPGRSPWRRKKNCLFMAIPLVAVVAFMRMIEINDVYTPLRPLSDAKSEARRLLKIMTHYNYQCNATAQIGNTSVWPLCIDKEVGLNLETKQRKIVYTIGIPPDYVLERSLALNYSFHAYLASSTAIPSYMYGTNNTKIIRTTVVANDPADFSRNSYGQRTVNDLLLTHGHSHITLLRLLSTAQTVEMWQLLRFLIRDNVLSNLDQLHLVVYIDKTDDYYLYNWYRTLYELFTKSGMYLYHTSSHDQLCLQVTLMESCIYFLSFVRNPGRTVFILYPPADYGTEEQESQRLIDYITVPMVECREQGIGGSSLTENSEITPTWQICADKLQAPCIIIRFRLNVESTVDSEFSKKGCTIYTVVFVNEYKLDGVVELHTCTPSGCNIPGQGRSMMLNEVFQFFSDVGRISLLEIEASNIEWHILTRLLNCAIIENVTQVVAALQLIDRSPSQNHPAVLRGYYSELRRLESFGFALFHSSHHNPCSSVLPNSPTQQQYSGTETVWCFRLGYINREFI